MIKSEYDYIDVIGETSETYKNQTEKYLNQYTHKQESNTVQKILLRQTRINYSRIIDLGCSIGSWYEDYKNYGFKQIIGIDISQERAMKAKARGYDEVHVCNAYNLPFADNSESCIISNDVFVHIINDSDKLKVFVEINRVLKTDGIFIFNIANAKWFGYDSDTTKDYCRLSTKVNIFQLLSLAQLTPIAVISSYFMKPLKIARPSLAKISSKLVYPLIDSILLKYGNIDDCKVMYFVVKKEMPTKC